MDHVPFIENDKASWVIKMPIYATKALFFSQLDLHLKMYWEALMHEQKQQQPIISQRMVVGLSGGLDSTVLLHLLVEYCKHTT